MVSTQVIDPERDESGLRQENEALKKMIIQLGELLAKRDQRISELTVELEMVKGMLDVLADTRRGTEHTRAKTETGTTVLETAGGTPAVSA